jgi:tripartite-type tricarboxylate transporter receptor subunit TctC
MRQFPPAMWRIFFIAVAMCMVATAGAQDWLPNRPVRIVVPWPAGGSADILGRLFAERLGSAFIVENKPGAGGTIGSATVARSEPDGYTLLVSGIPSHVIAPAMNPSVGYDPVRDFTHIAYIGGPPIGIVVHRGFGVSSLRDLLARARQAAAPVGYVSAGTGSLANLLAESWARKEGIKLAHIPYKGGTQATTDLIAGHVQLGFMTWTTAAPHIRAGTLEPLAVSATARSPDFPNVPTLAELGYGDLTATTWWSLSGPAGLPQPIVTRINRAVVQSLDLPEVRGKLAQEAIETKALSPEEFTALVVREIGKWGPVAQAAMNDQR